VFSRVNPRIPELLGITSFETIREIKKNSRCDTWELGGGNSVGRYGEGVAHRGQLANEHCDDEAEGNRPLNDRARHAREDRAIARSVTERDARS